MLLDTHVLLWLLADDKQLGSETRRLLATAPLLQASTASLWEIAIKSDLGKLTVPEDFPARVADSGIDWLDLSPAHVWTSRIVTGLLHRDPFDKLLLAVALEVRVPFLTADKALLSASLSPTIELVDARR